jgi:hypothetical protein
MPFRARPRTPALFSPIWRETTEMMILSRASRADAGALLRTTAHVFAAALVVTAIFAALWEGPAASASHSSAPARSSASPSPALVKYFIVPPAASGPAETLFDIAAKTLGAGNRFTQIFNLNKGRPEPNGGRLENASTSDPGWILQLPADADGPGVHIGPLPGATTPATPAASSRPASGTAAARRSPAKANGSMAVLAGGALMVFGTRRARRRAPPPSPGQYPRQADGRPRQAGTAGTGTTGTGTPGSGTGTTGMATTNTGIPGTGAAGAGTTGARISGTWTSGK